MFKKTTQLALAIRFATNFHFLVPIWFLYGTDILDMSSSLTVALFMLFPISIAFFEVPTGALADRLGAKKVSILGYSVAGFFPLSYLLFPSYPLLIAVCTIISGFGFSLISGTLATLVHASFRKEDLPQQAYNRYLANDRVVAFSARVIGGISAGFIYSLWEPGPYIGAFASNFLGMALFLFIQEEQTQRSRLSQTKHIVITWKRIVSKNLLQYVMISFIGFQLVAESIWTAYQPFYESDGLSPTMIGAIFSVIAVCSALSARASSKLMDRYGVLKIMTHRSLLIAATTFLLLQPILWLRIVAIVPAALAFGISSTPLDAAVQYLVPSKYHTTAISITSLLTMVTYAAASIHLGLLVDFTSVATTRWILFIESTFMIAALLMLYQKQKPHDLILSK